MATGFPYPCRNSKIISYTVIKVYRDNVIKTIFDEKVYT